MRHLPRGQGRVRPIVDRRISLRENEIRYVSQPFHGYILSKTPPIQDAQRELQDAWSLHQLGKFESAYEAFHRLTEHLETPNALADAWLGKAAALAKLGKPTEAIAALETAYTTSPVNPTICATYAQTLMGTGDIKRSVVVLRQGLDASPSDVTLLRVAADAFDKNNDVNGAIKVCETLLKLEPENTLIHLKLGRLRMMKGEYDKSLDHFQKVLSDHPDNLVALDGLSDVYRIQGPFADARKLLLKRAEISQSDQEKSAFKLKAYLTQPVIHTNIAEIDQARSDLANALSAGPETPFDDPWKLGLGPSFYLGYQGRDDRALQEALARYYAQATPSLLEIAPHVGRQAHNDRPLRVGLVSNFFSQHTIGYLSYGLISGLDRRAFDLHLFRTPRSISDSHTPRFLEAAPCQELPADLQAARSMIAKQELDILHFPEIGMDHFTYFLAFARLAPLQTVTWGHPITTGLPNIDLFLSVDAMEPAQAEAHYTEQLIRLKTLSVCVEHPDNLEVNSDKPVLDPERPAYLCAQSLFKLHCDFDSTLAKVLDRDSEGVLYFFSHGSNTDADLTARLADSMGDNIRRVKFLSRVMPKEFLRIVKAADVVLDVPQWSGGKTSLDTLAMGTPVVHQSGEFMRGRHTLAFYRKMGIDATIADNDDDYADLAVNLVHDRTFRKSIREQIAETKSVLFNDTSAIREIESIWARALRERT